MKRAGIPELMRLKGRQIPGLVVAIAAGSALAASLLLPDPGPQELQNRLIEVKPAEVLVLEQPAAGRPGSEQPPLLTVAPGRDWLLDVTLERAQLDPEIVKTFQMSAHFEPPPGWAEIRDRPAKEITGLRLCPSELRISPQPGVAPARLRVWQPENAKGPGLPELRLRFEGAAIRTHLRGVQPDEFSTSPGCWRHLSFAGFPQYRQYDPPYSQASNVADGSEIRFALERVVADPAGAEALTPFGLSKREPLTARALHVERLEDSERVLTLEGREDGALRVERLEIGAAGLWATVSGQVQEPAVAARLSRGIGGPDWLVPAGLAGLAVLGLLAMAIPAKARWRGRTGSPGGAPQAFISYTQADREWAAWVAWALEESGWSPILLDPDESAGSVFPLRMHQALMEAEKTAAILSESYCSSRFGALEWAATVADDPTGEKRKLVLLRVEPFTPPGLFKAFSYVDLAGIGEDSARKRIGEAFPPPASFQPGESSGPRPPYPGS